MHRYGSFFGTMGECVDTASQAYNSGELKSVDEAIQNVKDQVADGYNYITVE